MNSQFLQNIPGIKAWVFDLDDTLYAPESAGLESIKATTRAWASAYWNKRLEEVNALFLEYNETHGSVFAALKHHENWNMPLFVQEAYDRDHGTIEPNPRLAAFLENLPAQKVIFTTSPLVHARRVLKRLGVDESTFNHLIGIEETDFLSKPNAALYKQIEERLGLSGGDIAFVEDTAHNLKPAKDLGWRTVLVHKPEAVALHAACHEDLAHVDACYASLSDFLGDMESVVAAK